VSDPGAIVVEAAFAEGLPVSPVPGPSAVAAAISVCGFAASTFLFAGFLPPRAGARRRALETLRGETRPLVFYEAPHRVSAAVGAMRDVLGDRPVTLLREMTKLHEEVGRTTLSELARHLQDTPPRGEYTLVVAGRGHASPAAPETEPGDLKRQYEALVRDGVDPKEALKVLARRTGRPRREIYAAVKM